MSIKNDKTKAERSELLAQHDAAIADSIKYEQVLADTTSGRANGYIADMQVEELFSSQSTAGIDGLGATIAARAALAEIDGNAARQRASDQRNATKEAKNAKARKAAAARKAATLLTLGERGAGNGGEPLAKRYAHAERGTRRAARRTRRRRRAARTSSSAPAHQRTCAPAHLRTCAPAHLRTSAPAHQRTCAPAHLRTCTPAHLRTCAPAHLRTRAPAHPRTRAPAHLRTSAPAHQRTRARRYTPCSSHLYR